ICAMPNDKSDTTKLDVLFLLDTSSSIGEAQFQRALKLVVDTVKEFRNVGPDGIQVSLVQFNHEPYLEFSFRKHNCKPQLLEDIADTTYMKGVSNLGNAINKVAKFGFNKRRGDRPDADNVLVILTDGMSDDKIQQPLQLVRNNGTAVLVIAAIEARPELVRELVGHRESNIFNLSDALDRPLAERLSQRIRESQLDAMPPFSSVIMADVTESVTVPSTVLSAVSTETFTTEELPYTVTNEAFATEEHPDATETVGTISEVLTSTTEMRNVSEIMREESVTTTASSEPSTQTVPA
uniref:VWFA domain-containing protein n=1 Tax=Parascaris univalens TaxID=6257 RepID=A0A915BIQ6_PARUN